MLTIMKKSEKNGWFGLPTAGSELSRARAIALRVALIASALTLPGTNAAAAAPNSSKPSKSVDILVLGDSQLSFGSGPAFEAFFGNISRRCADAGISRRTLNEMSTMRTGMIGVRSTGMTTWLARTRRGKRMMCVRDPAPNSLVNASVWGAMKRKSRWVQIGQHRGYDYCTRRKSVLKALMDTFMMPPKLVIFHVMATDTNRWSGLKRIKADLKRLEADLPRSTACIYFTTAPTYKRSVNKRRVRAQRLLQKAIDETGSRCRLVNGLTQSTLAAFQGNAKFYHRSRNGRVRDPFHPTKAAASAYLRRHTKAFCQAIATAISGTQGQISTPRNPSTSSN